MRIIAAAIGAAEKGVSQVYESAFRPPEKRYRPWVERCHTQMHAALAQLERTCQSRNSEWLIGSSLSQADITATCVYTFLSDALGINRRAKSPKVRGLALVGAKQSPLALSPVSRTSRA